MQVRHSFKDTLYRLLGIPVVPKSFDHTLCFQPEVREWIARNPKENEMIGDLHHVNAGRKVQAEVERQNRMWGIGRDDHANGELMMATLAQLDELTIKQAGAPEAFAQPHPAFPKNWSGFRDYGSDVANLVVAAAWLHQEIARKLRAGEDDTRLSRNPETQPYDQTNGKPDVVLA
jgi:hypothetical protein